MRIQPVVSVWIVTYNHECFIRQCLASVINQKTRFPIEIIIGEDCSTDGTRAVIEEFEFHYPDLIKPIYHDVNVGAYRNAYEFCYPQLSGKYIACLEADDYWTDEYKLQKQVDALEADKTAIACFTQVRVLDEKTKGFEAHWTADKPVKERYTLEDILRVFNIVTCTLLFRNIYPVELPYDAKAFPTGDVSLSAFLLLQGDALFLNEVMAVYRVHNGGTFSSHSLEAKNLVFVKIFEQFLREPLFKEHRRLLSVLLSDRAYQALCFEIKKAEPDSKKVNAYYLKAIKEVNFGNLYFPLKTFARKQLYAVTGKAYGRELN